MSQAYQPPTAGSSNNKTAYGATSASAAVASSYDNASRPVVYLCGDCDAKVILRRGDAILCKECGHRVLYKERTNRMVQFEAR